MTVMYAQLCTYTWPISSVYIVHVFDKLSLHLYLLPACIHSVTCIPGQVISYKIIIQFFSTRMGIVDCTLITIKVCIYWKA